MFIVKPTKWVKCYFGPYHTAEHAKAAKERIFAHRNMKKEGKCKGSSNFNYDELVVQEV